MSKHVVSLRNVETVQNITKALRTKHHTFPLLNIHGNIVGLIPRNFIMVILRNESFYTGGAEESPNIVRRDTTNKHANRNRASKQVSINLNYSVSQEVQNAKYQRTETVAKYTDQYDVDEFSKTKEEDILHWTEFTRDFESKDIEFDEKYQSICAANREKSIDFRPYSIQNPFVVMTTDLIGKACELFRKMHLRQLIVVHPSNGSL